MPRKPGFSENKTHKFRSALLKRVREEAGHTQAALAKLLGVSRDHVNQVETCRSQTMQVFKSSVEDAWIAICFAKLTPATQQACLSFHLLRLKANKTESHQQTVKHKNADAPKRKIRSRRTATNTLTSAIEQHINLSGLLTELRIQGGFTQLALAKKLGISREKVNAIERCRSSTMISIEWEVIREWWLVCQDTAQTNTVESFKDFVFNSLKF